MANPPMEDFARRLRPSTLEGIQSATVGRVRERVRLLPFVFADVEAARTQAASIKDEVLADLGGNLVRFEAACLKHGIQVHWALDAARAREIVLDLASRAEGRLVVKAKSMVTEEIHLNAFLEAAGFEVVETDLGEYVVQIDGDHPSHIVAPIIHKTRYEVARSFAQKGLGPYTEDPGELTLQARARLREKFRTASIGISGVNFGVVESGRLVLVENEGNSRLSTTAPSIHIAIMGIEKLIPREADLPLFLRLLAGSATAQRMTTYVHLISGPRREDESDGPREVHLVLLDNGRSAIRSGPYRDVLRCIRCGACLNVCPVYRQASGHAYRHPYSGPIGAVLTPLLEGLEKMGDLARASTLCGACEEVCPVKIPLPHHLLRLRDEAARQGLAPKGIPWSRFASVADEPPMWRSGLTLLPLASGLSEKGWSEVRAAPRREGRPFRRWWDERS
ncbi:MAG TPA: lactate utilization protein B [Fimbriimonadaceae bacterium]|nr:lactate utilization protein B [Fimbriimonadaceae bacterium]HRJ97457.1 lactate utilization protein B [Fimbriimonadaceae bacterium]